MSEQADERLVAVLGEHEIRFPWGYRVDCTCGEWTGTPQFREDTRKAQHRAHVAAALREAGYVHRDEVADRLTAAIKLVQPEHLTPMGARQIRAVVNNWGAS